MLGADDFCVQSFLAHVREKYFFPSIFWGRTTKVNSIVTSMLVFLVAALSVLGMTALPVEETSRQQNQDNELPTYNFPYVSRSEWGARPPTEVTPLNGSIPYVVIHHSYIPPACYDNEKCVGAMRSMQNMHMDQNKWWDIGYHFGVGSNGVAYEGRGWGTLGAHALHFNRVSIGICLIGDWTKSLPTPEQMKTAKAIIAAGVELGYIKPEYKLVGHRQVRDTECPGETLYQEIQTWPHFSPFPRSHKDLLDVEEFLESDKEIIKKYRREN